jgi:cell division protein FtsB
MSAVRVRRWLISMVVVAILALLSAATPGGVRDALALGGEVERMRVENARLAAENAQLSLEIHALKTDPSAVERAVREELRYIRPGERVYVLEGERPEERR